LKLSIVIPCYNESQTIAELLNRVNGVDLGAVEKEIIIVDDGSTDGTRDLLRQLPADESLQVLFHTRNRGKGAAMRTGIQAAGGDVVLVQDADLEYNPADYPALLAPFKNGTEVVYGSRLKHRNKIAGIHYLLGAMTLTLITNLLYGTRITDEPTGYKLFKADVIKSLHLVYDGFEFCPEVTAKVSRRGYRIEEVPITYEPRSVTEGKKIGWKDFFIHVYVLFKYRLLPEEKCAG
jgi:glycosyltransferase involved in cell wall biosynthesis